jgi:predicted dehydrogenase
MSTNEEKEIIKEIENNGQPFGWCFIGAGSIANTVAKEIVKTGRHKVVSIWNRTQSKATLFSEKFNSRSYAKAEDAILAEGVDGVYIALTADQHESFTKLALRLGKPVLCEKPFAVNKEAAIQMFEEAKIQKLYLSEAMWTWYNDTAIQVRKWISEGKIGKILSAKMGFEVPVAYGKKDNRHLDPNRVGGALLDLGVYPVRYAYGQFGMPESIVAVGDVRQGVDFGEKMVFHYIDFDVKLSSSMVSFRGEKAIIKGTEGSITIPWFHMSGQAALKNKEGKSVFTNSHGSRTLLFVPEFDRVASEIKRNLFTSAFVTMESTLDTMSLLDDIRSQIGLKYPCETKAENI